MNELHNFVVKNSSQGWVNKKLHSTLNSYLCLISIYPYGLFDQKLELLSDFDPSVRFIFLLNHYVTKS